MNIDPDDPRLTAFALGELSGADYEAMERAVAASAEAQARVQEIQEFAGLLREEFRADLQRAAEKRPSILSLLEQGNFWSDWRWVSLAAAALLAICAVIAAVALSPRRDASLVAAKEKPDRADTIVEMEITPTPPERLARSDVPSKLPATASAPETDRRSGDNAFASAAANPVSAFPVQVGNASYSKVRRSIRSGARPPKHEVRIEEMINYFEYDYPQPEGDRPFSITADAAICPWQPPNQLVRIGLKGREIANANRGASNLVFLLDVSGSMQSPDRLPLIKRSMRLLVDRLNENDRIAIVVYAGASGIALPSTPGNRKEEIVRALEELKADALSGGVEGIELAYRVAADQFIKGGTNRVVVATDGELNVGVASDKELIQLANKRAKTGIELTLLDMGDDGRQSAAMQQVAEKVRGNYAFLDTVDTARKTLLEQINGTAATIAKDVEVEVVFNPPRVSSYRLIGYDDRTPRREESDGGGIAAGEVAAGHSVTALYEVVPAATPPAAAASAELLTVKLHHKQPESGAPVVTEHSLDANVADWRHAPADFRFAAAVAEFGMILRGSPHKGNGTLAGVLDVAENAKGADPAGYRAGFIDLVRRAQALAF